MAGIGFRLQKLFQEDYLSSRVKAYGFSLFVTAGPWLIVILSITGSRYLLSLFHTIPIEEQKLFTISLSYCFIFSLIVYGGLQLIVTRYVADLLYEQKTDRIYPSFIGMTKLVLICAFVLWLIFACFTTLPLYYKFMMLFLFLGLHIIWIQSIYLTAAKDYQSIAYAFLTGSVVFVLEILVISFFHLQLGIPHGYAFLLLTSFTSGIFITLVWLSIVMMRMFPTSKLDNPYTFLSYIDKFPELFWTGFLYNLGIWTCNFVIWFGEGREVVAGSFLYHPIYDTTVFWAYLTILPTYVFFVVSVETRFYERYKKYYGAVNSGGTLHQILELRDSMIVVMRQEVYRLIRNQGIITLLIIFSAWIFISQTNSNQMEYSIFQLTALGAFSNGMVLILTLLLLYFEDRRGALRTSAIFFLINLIVTLALLPLGYNGYGISFVMGASIAFLYAFARLIHYVQNIDYYTFCQPDQQPRKRMFFTKLAEKLNKLS
ncbi:exopolysaccharide Pel transporter PelG [Ectobacillus polymachus]|uniref:exopolysaccharide Pel transporter PelG n=1 Tax=Ectobacillus polymachus TaxID=1508806 RepID=UPI003A854BD5